MKASNILRNQRENEWLRGRTDDLGGVFKNSESREFASSFLANGQLNLSATG
jgi:hypothetical protein